MSDVLKIQFYKLLAVYLGLTVLWYLVVQECLFLTHTLQLESPVLLVFTYVLTGLFAALNYTVVLTKCKCFYYAVFIVDVLVALWAIFKIITNSANIMLVGLDELRELGARTILVLIAFMCLRVCFVIVLWLMTKFLWNHRKSFLEARSAENVQA